MATSDMTPSQELGFSMGITVFGSLLFFSTVAILIGVAWVGHQLEGIFPSSSSASFATTLVSALALSWALISYIQVFPLYFSRQVRENLVFEDNTFLTALLMGIATAKTRHLKNYSNAKA